MQEQLRKLDAQICRVEKALAGSLFFTMAAIMFAAVVADVFAREEGRLSLLAIKLLNLLGAGIDHHSKTMHRDVSPWLNLGVSWLLCFAGLRTMVRQPPLTRRQAAAWAAVVTAGLTVAVFLLKQQFPNGVTWGSRVSLACMLWVGFLGASIATHQKRHLALEMGEKIWPRPIARYARALALLLTAAMCVFLVWLSWKSLAGHYRDWAHDRDAGLPVRDAERIAGHNTNIPVWFVLLIFPYTFGMMAIRFVGIAIAAATGTEKPPEERIG